MNATALICDANQNFSLQPVTLADPKPNQIVLRNLYSGVSIGTEFAVFRGKLTWGTYPFCTGYQGVGIVESIGPEVTGVRVGDTMYYRGNHTPMTLATGAKVNTISGAHCSHILTETGGTHGAALLPAGVPADAASLFVLPACALLGTDMAQPKVGDIALVHGCGLIGLGAVNACSLRGCTVIAVDVLDNRLAVARKLGADHIINAKTQNLREELAKIAPDGADIVYEATGIPSCVKIAMELCKVKGAFVWQGNYGHEPFPFDFMAAHTRRLRTHFPCDDGYWPFRRAVLKNMATGALPWGEVITHRVSPAEAPALYTRINQNRADDVIGAVIRWS